MGSRPSFGSTMRNQYGMRRVTVPSLRTTKPIASPSAEPALTARSSRPGTLTVAGTVIVALPTPVCGASETVHWPRRRPRRSASTDCAALLPVCRRAERDVGRRGEDQRRVRGDEVDQPAALARHGSLAGEDRRLPVRTRADFNCATVQSGWRCLRSAAPPATCGAAMHVPLTTSRALARGTDDVISTPGALTSGFSSSEIGVGPPLENDANRQLLGDRCGRDRLGRAARGGDAPVPEVGENSFPAATAGTTPASAAALIAVTTRSRRRLDLRLAERQVDDVHAVADGRLDPGGDLGRVPVQPEVLGRNGQHLVVADICVRRDARERAATGIAPGV